MFEWITHAKIFEAGHAVEWISGATGALGAVAGSVVTVTWTEVFNRRTRRRDLKARDQIAAFAVFRHQCRKRGYSHIHRAPGFCHR